VIRAKEHGTHRLDYWVFGFFPSSGILKNTNFWKLDLFPSSGEMMGPLP
jgi:hypothetical protein